MITKLEPNKDGTYTIETPGLVKSRLPAGRLLYTMIEGRGLTRPEVGRLLGLSASAITSYVRSIRPLTVQGLARAADALGCDLTITVTPRVPFPFALDGEPATEDVA